MKLSPKPKITIHYIKQRPSSLGVMARLRLPYLLLGVSLLGGLGLGGVVSWSYMGSKADSEPVGQVQGTQTNEAWVAPMEFQDSDLNIVTSFLPELIEENHRDADYEPLERNNQAQKLKNFFEEYNSPFGKDSRTIEAFLDSRNMNLMIAISFVESTMGKKCYYNNCSGIGGYPPNLRKYDTHADWVRDFDEVLENGYKGVPIEDFLGVYVQPGSQNWLNGVKRILSELEEAGIK